MASLPKPTNYSTHVSVMALFGFTLEQVSMVTHKLVHGKLPDMNSRAELNQVMRRIRLGYKIAAIHRSRLALGSRFRRHIMDAWRNRPFFLYSGWALA